MSKKNIIIGVAALMLLSGCAASVDVTTSIEPVGFWYGLWHGMIAVFAWFVSLFRDDVAMYAVYNTGAWYDFGFIMGIGGFSATTKVVSK